VSGVAKFDDDEGDRNDQPVPTAWIAPFLIGAVLAAVALWTRSARIRRDAISSSRRVLYGQAAEQLAPLVDGFAFLPQESRFLGHPVDYVVFEGLGDDDGELSIVFVEVKTGGAKLSRRERRIREAIEAGRVRFETLRM
jgi:predicted Holliday junction resolvase-like endonuclease